MTISNDLKKGGYYLITFSTKNIQEWNRFLQPKIREMFLRGSAPTPRFLKYVFPISFAVFASFSVRKVAKIIEGRIVLIFHGGHPYVKIPFLPWNSFKNSQGIFENLFKEEWCILSVDIWYHCLYKRFMEFDAESS